MKTQFTYYNFLNFQNVEIYCVTFLYFRIHKVPGAHYESAATRKYIHGRTETIRSCSNESIAFAKAMLDDSKSDNDKVAALKEAVNAHKKYSVEVKICF